MRGAPQVGFSATVRKIKARTSLLTRFRPSTCLTLQTQAKYKRNHARSQFTTVLGVTIGGEATRFSRHKLVQYSAPKPPGLLIRRLDGDVVQRLRESSEATSMMGLGSWRMARTKAATSWGSNCVLAQRSSSLRASSAVRPFL